MLVMNSVYLILGTFLFLIFVLPFNTTTIMAQTDYDCKTTQISMSPTCNEVCIECAQTNKQDICNLCDQCKN